MYLPGHPFKDGRTHDTSERTRFGNRAKPLAKDSFLDNSIGLLASHINKTATLSQVVQHAPHLFFSQDENLADGPAPRGRSSTMEILDPWIIMPL